MGSMGLIFTPVLVKRLLGHLHTVAAGLSRPMTNIFGLIATLNSPIGRYNPSPVSHSLLPTHPTPLLPTHPPFIHAIHDITVVVKKVAQIQQC